MTDQPVKDPPASFDLALVHDDAPSVLDTAQAILDPIRARLASCLQSTDLLFLDPSLLVFVLHLDPAAIDRSTLTDVALDARQGGFRVLKPTLLGSAERERFYGERLARFDFREVCVDNLDTALAALKRRLEARADTSKEMPARLRLTLPFASEEAFLAAFEMGDADTAGRMFIPSLALPPVGTSLSFDIVIESGQGPFEVNAHVIDITTPADQTEPGYTVAFVLPPERARLFKTFLTAVRNRAPWSERDSSRAKRVRIRLPIEFFDGEGVRCEFTGNVSVGGLFIECRNPPARGAPLALQLYSAGRTRRVQLLCRVVHTISTARASELGFKPGAGVQFTEPTDAVTEKLTQVLGSIGSPRQTHAMVVDDDRFFRTVLGNLLRHEGFIVWEAEDGDRAFELLLEHVLRLDLLLLDLKMPGMSGSDLVEMVRSVGGQEDLAVVVVTGTTLCDEERHLIAALGADDIIAKDVPQEETLDRVFRVLADKKKNRA